MTKLNEIAMRTRLALPFEQALEVVTAALKAEGFGVLTEIDVKAALKKKIDVDFRRYLILGTCNPHLAHQSLTSELEIGLLLPCNVIVYEDEDSTVVSMMDPQVLVMLSENPALLPLMTEAHARFERVLAALEQ